MTVEMAERVVFRFLIGKEWTSPAALEKYLREHPKADRKKHWVGDAAPSKAKAKKPGKPSGKAKPKQEAKATKPKTPKKPKSNRGPIEIERFTGFKKEAIEAASKQYYDDDQPSDAPWEQLYESTGKDTYAATDWAYSWLCGQSEDDDDTMEGDDPEETRAEHGNPEADEFLFHVREKGSWANIKYSATQTIIEAKMDALKKRGVIDDEGYVTLYRGIKPPQADEFEDNEQAKLGVDPLSCWSEDPLVANKFSMGRGSPQGKVMKAKIHYSRMVNMWEAENEEWWAIGEREWTVMADKNSVIDAEPYTFDYADRPQYSKKPQSQQQPEQQKLARLIMSEEDDKPKKTVKLDKGNEGWLRQYRLDELRKRGWKGSLKEWYDSRRAKKSRG